MCMCELLAKPWYLGKNREIEKRTHRLRQFDIRETPFVNKYGNTNSFIIIFGSGHCSSREVRGKSSSVTTHRIPIENVTAMFYEFAIIQCPISQSYKKGVWFPVLGHWLASNRTLMKFIHVYDNDVMMHVKIYKDVIGCRDSIALWLPKYQWISGDAHAYSFSFRCTCLFIKTRVIA